MPGPEHACAIITDQRGRLLLQLRPPWVRHAPSMLTCFGGKRTEGEDALACLHRELTEELAWRPAEPAVAVDLWQGPRWIARFFAADLPADATLRIEAGSVAVRAPVPALPGLPVSPWHVAVLAAWQAGGDRVELPPRPLSV